MRSFVIILIAACAVFLACSESPSEPAEPRDSTSPFEQQPMRGIAHWTNFFEWDEATTASAARAGLIIFPIDRCFSPEAVEIIARLREINPDIKILGYLGVLQVSELYPDTAYLEKSLPWTLDFYRLVEDNWAWTTAGDTFSIWPGSIFLNPIDEYGRADRELMDGIVDLLEEYNNAWPDAFDGVMHDYFMYQPWVNPNNENVIGDLDLDGNGILIGNDENERAVFLRWQKDYAAAIRSRLGRDFIQIANGKVPQEDAELAGYLNGIFYEWFPNMTWSLTDRAGLEKLLENQADGWLAEAHGRTWSLLTNNVVEYNNMFCMLSSLLADCFYTELVNDFTFQGWSIDIDAGQALSGLTVEGNPDSIMTYRRSFGLGEASISFNPTGGRREWTFIENN
ncbi:MAG: hypothetical protein U5O15_10775 [Candidatus Krumholzibacteriota bacterium]|nr:hypothetical protein [Candidatus Krumholzibacteriota bacterium]